MKPHTTRVEAIVFAKNTIAQMFRTGMSSEAYQKVLHSLKKLEYINIPTASIQCKEDAEKLYNEAYQNYCIIIAFDNNQKIGSELTNSHEFATYVCNHKSETLQVYVWYPSHEEATRLAKKILMDG